MHECDEQSRRSTGLRVLSALCVVALLLSASLFLLFGLRWQIALLTLAALSGVLVPAAADSSGLLEVLVEGLNALVDGCVAIFEFFTELFSSLLG